MCIFLCLPFLRGVSCSDVSCFVLGFSCSFCLFFFFFCFVSRLIPGHPSPPFAGHVRDIQWDGRTGNPAEIVPTRRALPTCSKGRWLDVFELVFCMRRAYLCFCVFVGYSCCCLRIKLSFVLPYDSQQRRQCLYEYVISYPWDIRDPVGTSYIEPHMVNYCTPDGAVYLIIYITKKGAQFEMTQEETRRNKKKIHQNEGANANIEINENWEYELSGRKYITRR